MKSYKTLIIKNIRNWSYGTAITGCMTYLLSFLLLCFAFAQINENRGGNSKFILNFEKYLILASGLFLLIPFMMSFVLISAILHKNLGIIFYWIIATIGFFLVYVSGLVSSGIFLSVKGSVYVGYIAIALGLIFGCFALHSVLVIYFLKGKLEGNAKDDVVSECSVES